MRPPQNFTDCARPGATARVLVEAVKQNPAHGRRDLYGWGRQARARAPPVLCHYSSPRRLAARRLRLMAAASMRRRLSLGFS